MTALPVQFEINTLRNRARLLELGGSVETRAPVAATQKLDFTSPGLPMPIEWDAETAIRMAFYANVIAFRCVQIRANAAAACPFRAGPRAPERPGETVKYNDRAPLAKLLGPPPGGPSPKTTARRLWAWSWAQRITTGRHAWEIELSQQGTPVALWPMPSAWLKPIESEGGVEPFKSFEYGRRYDLMKKLKPEQVLYGWWPSALDWRQPESPFQAARLDVSIAVMGDRYSYGFLKNDARPAALVVTEQFNSDDEYKSFQRHWNSEHQGPDNAGRTAFLEANGDNKKGVAGAIDVKVLGLSQRDARFIEQHQASLERVAMALGVPWSLLDASGRTFDNADQEWTNFWMNTMLPDLSDFADEVNMQLAPRLGSEVGWFDLSHVRVFQEHQAPVSQPMGAVQLVQGGLMTVNEARADYGLAPVDGGDELGVVEPSAPPAPEVPALPAPQIEPVRVRIPPPRLNRLTSEQHEARRLKVWRRTDATVRTLEKRWEREMRRLFRRQESATIARVEGKRGRQATEGRALADNVFDPNFWLTETAEVAAALYELVVANGFARIADWFGIDFDLEAPWAQRFIHNRANQLAGYVTQTTYEAIQSALARGVEEGLGIPQIADMVRHVFEVATDTRATLIARTEVISAFNGSASLSAHQLPPDVVGGQEWIATPDQRTREDHLNANGQVTTMDGTFDVGGTAMAYPGDPAGGPDQTANCRCTVGFLTPAEMAERIKHGQYRVTTASVMAVFRMAAMSERFDELAVRRALAETAA